MTLPAWHGWLTGSVVTALVGLLAFTRLPADLLFMAAVTALLVSGVLTPADAFAGFANEGVITIAALYVVVAGVRDTGGIQWIVQNLLGRPRSLTHAQLRLTLPVTGFSAFLNNTPVVAMMIPAVSEWARRFNLPESKLFIPLSYAAILGGTCTLIGTSTNLVVNGLLIRETGHGLGMFQLTPIGIPVAVVGLLVIYLGSRWLLPDRRAASLQMENVREYVIEMLVDDNGALAGRTIEEAGLRHLPGCFLLEINRGQDVLAAVGPQERLQSGDRLVFVGAVDSVVDLQKIRGLTPATNQVFKLEGPRSRRTLVEAVVSDSCPVVGQSIREGEFRTRYQAAVIAVARNGERLKGKVGDIVLRPGDTLLLEAGQSFLQLQRHSRDFFLTRHIEGSAIPRHERAATAAGILAGMVLLSGFGVLPILHAALLAAGLMIAARCVSVDNARASVDWSVLVVIAGAFGISAALEKSGVAAGLAGGLISLGGDRVLPSLAMVYVTTILLTAVMSNNAAAALVFPIAVSVAGRLGVAVLPFAIAIIFAASASYATPIGYQTNLMVMGPGGYRFGDYLRIGVPITIVTGCTAFAVTAWYLGLH